MSEYLSTKELTDLLGISRASVYRRMADGMPYLKVGSLTRFPKERVIAWLEGRESGGEEEEILPVGDYRCLSCGWVGHVECPSPLSQLWCPRCGTRGKVERALS